MRKLSPTRAARDLESLLLCTKLAHQHSQDVVQAVIREVNRNDGPGLLLPMVTVSTYRTSDRVAALYVRERADMAWREKFNNVRQTLSCPTPGDFCEHLAGGVQTVAQYSDGLITFKELVFWVIDALARYAKPEDLVKSGITQEPATVAPSARKGVEL